MFRLMYDVTYCLLFLKIHVWYCLLFLKREWKFLCKENVQAEVTYEIKYSLFKEL